MQTKTCRKCQTEKPISDFHKNRLMRDGYLNHCKYCCNAEDRKIWREQVNDPVVMAQIRASSRVRGQRYRSKRKRKPHPALNRRWLVKNRHKSNAEQKLRRAVYRGLVKKADACQECGAQSSNIQGHHTDYSKPLYVKWLCPKCHGEAHRKPFGAPVARRAP